ncbi:MAG: hypothetical protein ABIJ97_12885 [Bacteroidota bacterium]
MGFLNKIKTTVGNSVLRSKVKSNSRERAVFNFETARTAGVVLYTKDTEYFSAAQKFVKYLKDHKIETWSLGYADSAEVINAYAYQIGMNHFTNKNLNWYNKPISSSADQFITKEFDLLIDLCTENFYPIQYIVGMSKAKFKIGGFVSDNSNYDMMINIEKNKNIDYLIEQVKHYISIIKQKDYV